MSMVKILWAYYMTLDLWRLWSCAMVFDPQRIGIANCLISSVQSFINTQLKHESSNNTQKGCAHKSLKVSGELVS
ncbi:hypothetical protein AgCh_027204 [Apium graveolens]